MAKRLIQTLTNVATGRVVKIYRDAEWEEYVVKQVGEAGDGYHTDDKQDAIDTANVMLNT